MFWLATRLLTKSSRNTASGATAEEGLFSRASEMLAADTMSMRKVL